MSHIARMGLKALAGGAGLALSIAQAQPVQHNPGSPIDTQPPASPATKRLGQFLEVLNGGDPSAISAYLQSNSVAPMKAPPGPTGMRPLPLIGQAQDLYRRSRGLDLVRVVSADDSGALAIVRDRLTADEQGLAIKVEPQPPHRIVALPFVPSSTVPRSAPEVQPEQSEAAQLESIGSYLRRLSDADVFSGVVIVTRDGKPVFSQAYGYADREKKIANTVETPFILASMNKLFTGLAIGQLVEQGKLSYDDPLAKFVPDYPDGESAKRIKIKHLLTHTAGLNNGFGPAFVASLDRLRSVQAFIDVAAREPLKFEPGTRWDYSNTGYQLLGRVIEVVTGDDYYDYMDSKVFAPAGITRSSFPHYDRDAIAFAYPYEIELDGGRLHYVNKLMASTRRGSPAGMGLGSAPDIINFANALRAGRIVKPETLRLHASPKPELASPSYGYGFSTMARMAKRPLIGHGGNAAGICTEFGVLADTPYTIVVLSNSTISTCVSVMGKILEALVPSTVPGAT